MRVSHPAVQRISVPSFFHQRRRPRTDDHDDNDDSIWFPVSDYAQFVSFRSLWFRASLLQHVVRAPAVFWPRPNLIYSRTWVHPPHHYTAAAAAAADAGGCRWSYKRRLSYPLAFSHWYDYAISAYHRLKSHPVRGKSLCSDNCVRQLNKPTTGSYGYEDVDGTIPPAEARCRVCP